MKKSERNILIAIILIAIVVYGYYQGWFDQFLPSQSTAPPPATTTPGERQNYEQGIGTYNVRTSAHCSLDMATSYTVGTECKVYWYKRHGTEWINVATGDNKYVSLKPEDNGYLWVVVKIPSGQNYYVDYQKIISSNAPDVDMYLYTDVDGDLVKEFAFRYDVRGVAIPSSGYPVVWFYVFLLPYDTSFTGLNDLSNDTGIGGSTTTKYYDYYLSFSASKKAVAIYKVELRIGTTDETKFEFKRLEIPGIGLVLSSASADVPPEKNLLLSSRLPGLGSFYILRGATERCFAIGEARVPYRNMDGSTVSDSNSARYEDSPFARRFPGGS